MKTSPDIAHTKKASDPPPPHSDTEIPLKGIDPDTIRIELSNKENLASVLPEEEAELEVGAEQKKEGVIESGSVFVLAMCRSYRNILHLYPL